MDKASVKKVLDELKKGKERKFKQTVDLIVVFKNLNFKKPEEQVDFYQQLHFGIGKEIKICGFIGRELAEQAKDSFTTAVIEEDFPQYAKDDKLLKILANEHDFFVAQANIMPKVATTFGKVLGPKGKMPNPKAGCVVPPNANLKALAEKLKKTLKVSAKVMPMVQLAIGKEDGDEKEVIDNILTTYDGILHHVPSGLNNIRKVLLKLTMGKPIKLE